jgi:hypothetical protein
MPRLCGGHCPKGSDLIEPLDDIIASSKSGSDMSKLMLAYAGKGPTTKQPIEINEVIREVVQLAKSRISEHTELVMDISDDALLVLGETGAAPAAVDEPDQQCRRVL